MPWALYPVFMCGRYVRRSDKQQIAERFRLGKLPEGFLLPPDYNIAPSTFQPVIRQNRDSGLRELVLMRWGMQPNFAESRTAFHAYATINARAESILKNRMWRVPFTRRRCLVPADFYLEWKTLVGAAGSDELATASPALSVEENGAEPTPEEGTTSRRRAAVAGSARAVTSGAVRVARIKRRKPTVTKQPWAYSMVSGRPFAFGGLWDAWRDPALPADDPNAWLQSFAVITVEANELAAEVHTRMPEIIYERDYDLWLDRSIGSTPDEQARLLALLKPFDADLMRAAPANPAVGNVRNNGPEMLIQPLTPVPVSADPNEPTGSNSQ